MQLIQLCICSCTCFVSQQSVLYVCVVQQCTKKQGFFHYNFSPSPKSAIHNGMQLLQRDWLARLQYYSVVHTFETVHTFGVLNKGQYNPPPHIYTHL